MDYTDEVTTEDLKHILIETLCEEEPQDLDLLEDMVGYNKNLISNALRELKEDKNSIF